MREVAVNQIAKCREDKLGKSVRSGCCGSDPRLVPEFIRSRTVSSNDLSRKEQWQAQAGIVGLLFETAADTLLAECWRSWCLQCCCMLLNTLRCLSCTLEENEQTDNLENEMALLKNYFF